MGVPAASNDEIGAAARASAKAKVHVSCSALHFLLVPRHWRDDKASTPRGVGLVAITFDASR